MRKAGDEQDLDELVARLKRGDGGALEAVYRLFGGKVFGLAYHLLASREAAEDAVSEVFLRVRRSAAQFDGRVPFDRWLLKITSHLCVDWLRRRRVESRLFEPPQDSVSAEAPSALDKILLNERNDALRDALRKLPDRYRAPLVLRYYGELSYDEIAERLGIDRSAVGVLLFRARQELRRIMSCGADC
ncbi:MAG TPA: RNA polymerase sigma factor [Bryobacteraceae bacterium]